MYKLASYLLLITLFSYKAAFSQQFDLLNYNTDNGLPSNTVYNIFRDHNGLLWFGTDKGVATYDGHIFTTYTTFNGLADNEIFFFQEDLFHRIWMSTFNAKLSYYKNGVFYKGENAPYLRLPIHASVMNFIILEDDSSVSMAFLHYPIIVNILKNHVTIIDLHKLSPFFQSNNVISVKKINQNEYRVYTPDVMAIIDTNAQLTSICNYRNKRRYIYAINQNQEYFLDSNIIYSKNFKKLFTTNIHFKTKEVCIYNDGKNFYVGNENGLTIDNKWKLLGNSKITSITQDRNGNYWIGTMGSGAYMLSKDYTHTVRYDNCYKGKVNYAFSSKGNVYYENTDNSLYRFNNGHYYNLFRFPSLHSGSTPYDIEAYFLQGENYYAFHGHNLFVFPNINDLHPNVIKYKIEITDQIKNVHYSLNNFYLTTSNDILKLPIKKGKPAKHLFYKSLINRRWPRLYSIGIENNQRTLYSTIDSVYTVDTSGTIAYEPQLGTHPFKWGHIMGNYMICCTNKNELLIGTRTASGIADTIIQQPYVWNGAYQLDTCHLLLASNNLYHLLTVYPTNGKPKLQLQVLEYPFIPKSAEYITADERAVYFFKNGSITTIDRPTLFQHAAAPVAYFTLLKTRNSVYTTDSLPELSYKDSRHLTIQFDIISYDGKQFAYEYSITKNGADTWHNITGNEINLIDPVFGTYTVKLRARSASSVYSNVASFRLIINKPFWASWWFITLLSVGLLLLFFTFAYYIFRRALKRKQQAHEAELKFLKSEYKAANALMNPHFMFNSLNSIQYFINNDNKLSANKYLNVFSKMLRQNMLNISKEMITLQNEIDLVISYLNLEKLRFKDCLRFSLNIDENLELELIKVPPLLLQPIVENAIKHGLLPKQSTDNYIDIRIEEINDDLRIEIQDNGVGFSKSAQTNHTSFALENIKKRISQLRAIYGIEISIVIKELSDNNGTITGTLSSIMIRLR